MKKTSAIIMAACLCIGSLTGCEKTPEEVIVKQKGEGNIKDYEGEEEVKGSLAERLGAPAHYTNTASYEDGRLVIDTDADVVLPKADSMNTVSVSAREVNQEMIDAVTNTFFEGNKIYNGTSYVVATKDMLQEKITELKKYKAEGNLDPYDMGDSYDIDAVIERLEGECQTAPESAVKEEVTPQFGLEYMMGDGTTGIMKDSFLGVAETENGVYDYQISHELAPNVTFEIRKRRDDVDSNTEGFVQWANASGFLNTGDETQMTEEEIKEYAAISYEDALQLAQEKVDRLGWGLELCGGECALYYESDMEGNNNILDGGYIFDFARKIDGAFITNTTATGGMVADGDATSRPWMYERCRIIVGDDGIQEVEICNPYDVGEVQTENVKLMDFESMIKIYEQMMEVSNAGVMEQIDQRTYRIRRIELGYARIYEPASDDDTGLLVPVWDFFGGYDDVGEGYSSEGLSDNSRESVITINAIDGTVIDRELGY